MSTPRVTVLMSVHNGGRYLHEAVHSVLAQTWRDFEFFIIDDASTDQSVAVIESFADPRIRLLRNRENLGLTRSLNRGLREARGEFIARQDADDLSAPERLALQIVTLDAHPEVPLLGSQAWLIDARGHSRGVRNLPLEPISIRWESLLDNPLIHTAVMFRTAVVRDDAGGYDESFACCQDYALWARVLAKSPVLNLRARLVSVREHAASISATRGPESRLLVEKVVRSLLAKLLPSLALSDSQIALLCQYRHHLAPTEVPAFHELLTALETSFRARFPEAQQSRDLGRTRARELARIAYNLIGRDRRLASREFVRAWRRDPRIALEQPWARIATLFVFGARSRLVVERLRARRERRAE